MRYAAALACILCAAGSGSAQVSIDGKKGPLALKPAVSGAFLDLSKSAAGTIVEIRLLASSKLAWLERSAIDNVLKEQELQAAFGPESGSQRAALGKLLKADLILLLRLVANKEDRAKAAFDLVVFETRGGLRLLARSLPVSKNAEADAAELERLIDEALRKQAERITDVCAVPAFISNDLDYKFDHLKGAFAKVLEQHLLRLKGVLLVELAEAQALAKEAALADPGARLERMTPLYFLGDYRHQGTGQGARVTIGLKLMRGQQELSKATKSGVPPSDAPRILVQLAGEVAAKALSQGERAADPAAEAKQLAQRALAFQQLESWNDSLATIEASLLLEPEQPEMRRRAALACAMICNKGMRAANKDPGLAMLSLITYLRGLEHQEFYLRPAGKNPKPRMPTSSDIGARSYDHEVYNASDLIRNYKPPTPELKALKSDVQSAEFDSLLRLTRAHAQDLWGDEHRYLGWALIGREERAAYAVVQGLILELQELQWAKERTLMFALQRGEDRGLYSSFLDRLATDGNAAVKSATATLKKRLEKDLAAKPAPLPDSGKSNVEFRPLTFTPDVGKPFSRIWGCMPVGDNIDVVWTIGNLFLMKEKGKLKQVWNAGELNAVIDHVCFDGRYFWAPVRRPLKKPLLLVLDPIDEKIWQVTEKDGLPLIAPEDLPTRDTFQFLGTAPLAPGKICLAGSFGRSWLAIATFDPFAGASVRVFHEAREAYDRSNKDQWKSTTVAFTPQCMFTLTERGPAGKATQRVLIARGCANGIVENWPLLVDPDRLTVAVAPEATYLPDLKFAAIHEGSLYVSAVFPGTPKRHLTRIDFPGTKKEIILRDVPKGRVAFHGPRLHLVGERWLSGSLTPPELRPAAMLPPEIDAVCRSAHYGLLLVVRENSKITTNHVVFSGSP